MKKMPLSKGIILLPNLITTLSLFCGFYSIIHSLNGDFYYAAWAIYCAGFFDLLDGRIARMTRTQSDFGVEYDSLSDLSSFGLAPSILLYTWTLFNFGRLGWLAAFLYFACTALRLARFNVQINSVEKKSFQGLPTPASAGIVAGLILLYQSLYGTVRIESHLALAIPFVLGPLMVSNIRYRSFKDFDLRNRQSFYLLVLLVASITVVALQPDIMPFFVFGCYVVSGPVEEFIMLLRRDGSQVVVEADPEVLKRGKKLGRIRTPKISLIGSDASKIAERDHDGDR